MNQSKQILTDKKGREIMVGDTLKVYHYTASLRREKCYMYKYVRERIKAGNGEYRFIILHQSRELDKWYCEAINGRQLDHVEIVQGYAGVELGQSFRDRPKHKQGSKVARIREVRNELT